LVYLVTLSQHDLLQVSSRIFSSWIIPRATKQTRFIIIRHL